ncbi:MAG: response regulator [Armatimonadetes bacterium]|nr:response regulator [Armatimonadota bacterium]
MNDASLEVNTPSEELPVAVLLVEDTEEAAIRIREMLQASTSPLFQVTHVRTIQEALLRATQDPFGLVILDLALPDSHGLVTFTRMQKAVPRVPIVVLTDKDEDTDAESALDQGAQDYLVKSQVDDKSLARSLRKALRRQAATAVVSEGRRTPKVVALCASRAGMGKSLLTSNIATVVAQDLKKNPLVVDLEFGAPAIMLGVKPDHGLIDLLDTPPDQLEEKDFTRCIQMDTKNVSVLVGSPKMEYAKVSRLWNASLLGHLLQKLGETFDPILIDMPILYDEDHLAMLSLVDSILLVFTGLEILTLRETQGFLTAMTQSGVPKERIRLILNRFDQKATLSNKEIGRLFGEEPWATLPNDEKEALQNINAGQPVVLKGVSQPLARAYRDLVRRLFVDPDSPAEWTRIPIGLFGR